MPSLIDARVCEVGLRGRRGARDFMLDSMGLRTGIDIPMLLQVRAIVERNLPGTELYGAVAKAGLPAKYAGADARAR